MAQQSALLTAFLSPLSLFFFIVLSDQAVAEASGDDRGRLDDNDVTVVVNCVLCSENKVHR
jgi:hypothetical protein